jgi:hypothetical protein
MSTPARQVSPLKAIALITAIVVFVVGMGVLGVAGCKSFNRYQKRADANNRVQVTHINIRNAEQQADVVNAEIKATQAEAKKRVEEAKGIRGAQDEIAATLTDRYLQHEAIQAQRAIASSPSNSVIYVPSGNMGVPLIRDTSNDGAPTAGK